MEFGQSDSVPNHTEMGAPSAPERPLVALLLHDGIGPFHMAGALLTFGANGIGTPTARFAVCALEPGLIRTEAGFEIKVTQGLEVLAQADAVLLPGWPSMETPVPEALRLALRAAHARGAFLVGLCMGVLPLVEVGLLEGHAATTHWARVQSLVNRYPGAHLQAEQLYTTEGRVWTCAGGASAIDLCLHLLGRLCGSHAATQVARYIVSAPQRLGRQAQTLTQPVVGTPADARLREVLDWVLKNLHENLGIDAVARRAGLSVRAFTRGFRQAMGTTYGQWQLHQRLSRAQALLRGSEDPVESIATQVGFATAASLRQHFRRWYGLTPREYRTRTGSSASVPSRPGGTVA